MHATDRDDLLRLLRQRSSPCVSIYLPTGRRFPESQQNALRYQHLVDEAEQKLRNSADAARSRELLSKFQGLLKDKTFWTHRADGLAVLGSSETFEVFDLQQPVPERAIVADSFHVKPLVRVTQTADQYHVLAIQEETVSLYHGHRDRLDPLEPEGVPLTARDALTDESPPAPNRAEENSRGNPPPGMAAEVGDAKMELDRFYRLVDRAVLKQVSRDSGAPLVLAGLPELQMVFRSVSRNPHLLPEGISRGVPAQIDERFAMDAWKCVEPWYREKLNKIVNDFHVAKAQGMAAEELEDVAKAIGRDRVGTLLIEADRVIPGRFDANTGQLVIDESLAAADDVLDDFAEVVLRTDGTALVMPRDQMPTTTGVAAIFRF